MSKAKPDQVIDPRDHLHVLLAVRELLADPDHWCKGCLNIEAKFCLRGARLHVLGWDGIQHIGNPPGELQFARLLGFPGRNRHKAIINLEEWNDIPSTTHRDVLARLDAAILRAG